MNTNTVLTEHEFIQLSAKFPDLRLELINGEALIMPPVGGDSGRLEGAYTGELYLWKKRHQGEVHGPSTGFRLPNGDIRCADASLLLPGNSAYATQGQDFVDGVPDFLIEVRSPSDRMARLRSKMEAWIRAGCRLAWLIDPVQKRALVYTPSGYDQPRIRRANYDEWLTGEDVVPELELRPSDLDR